MILTDTPDNGTTPEELNPTLTEKTKPVNSDSVIVNTANKDFKDMVSLIDGSTWKVDYYHLVNGTIDVNVLPDPNAPSPTVQYQKIKDLELKVQTSLPNDGEVDNLIGSSFILANFKPVIGDFIVVTLANNKKAILIINKTERKTYVNKDIYLVEYKFFLYVDTNINYFNDIISNVTETLYSVNNKLVTKDVVLELLSFNRELDIIKRYYNYTFINKDLNIPLMPNQLAKVFIPELDDLFITLAGAPDETYSFSYRDKNKNPYTLINALLEANKDSLAFAEQKFNFYRYDTTQPSTLPYGAMYIDGLLSTIPLGHRTSIVNLTTEKSIYSEDTKKEIPDIEKVLITDSTFIFTTAFYDGVVEDMSILEKELYNFLVNGNFTLKVKDLISSYKKWSKQEQYLYLPFLYFIIIIIRDRNNISGV